VPKVRTSLLVAEVPVVFGLVPVVLLERLLERKR